MESPLVSVVIVTWNRREDVLVAVQSVYDQAYENCEIVVVDNDSTDGTIEALRQAYPKVRIVALDRNTGPTGGRNAGVAAAQGEIVFFLDSDARLGHDTLATTVRKFEAEPDVGVIACKVVNAYSRELDRYAGWIFSEKDKADQDREFLSFSFSECGCAIRKKVFDRVGPFWELLFFGREGEELSLRVWDAGFKILYWPEAIVYHRVPQQERMACSEHGYFDLRNSLYIYLARYPWWMLAGFVPLRIGVSLVRGVKRRYLQQVVRALFDVMRQLPTLWRQRQPISNETARLYLSLQREHGPLRWDVASWLRHKA
jgi:hypothetical protein